MNFIINDLILQCSSINYEYNFINNSITFSLVLDNTKEIYDLINSQIRYQNIICKINTTIFEGLCLGIFINEKEKTLYLLLQGGKNNEFK